MKFRPLAPLALAVALGFAGQAFAKSDKPSADWMPAEQVKQKLMDAGYSSITELEADDGHWEGEGDARTFVGARHRGVFLWDVQAKKAVGPGADLAKDPEGGRADRPVPRFELVSVVRSAPTAGA